MKRIALLISSGLLVSTFSGVPAVAQDKSQESKPSYLFVFDGRAAELRPIKEKSGNFEFRVPVESRGHFVTWFSDRPNRDSGQMDLAVFTSLWEQKGTNSFRTDKPNVALVFNDETLVASMGAPSIISKPGGREVFRATLTPLKSQELARVASSSSNLRSHAKRVTNQPARKKQKLGSVSVFIDPATTTSSALCPIFADYCPATP